MYKPKLILSRISDNVSFILFSMFFLELLAAFHTTGQPHEGKLVHVISRTRMSSDCYAGRGCASPWEGIVLHQKPNAMGCDIDLGVKTILYLVTTLLCPKAMWANQVFFLGLDTSKVREEGSVFYTVPQDLRF